MAAGKASPLPLSKIRTALTCTPLRLGTVFNMSATSESVSSLSNCAHLRIVDVGCGNELRRLLETTELPSVRQEPRHGRLANVQRCRDLILSKSAFRAEKRCRLRMPISVDDPCLGHLFCHGDVDHDVNDYSTSVSWKSVVGT